MKADTGDLLYAVLIDCMTYMYDYCSTGIIVGIMFSCMYCLISLYLCNSARQTSAKVGVCLKLPFAFLLSFYLYLVLGITILSRDKGPTYIIRPIPFTTWGTDLWHLTLWAENILMMIPLGILLYILWVPFRKIGRTMVTGFLISLLIECIQLVTRLGKFETDDIINNVTGTLIGFLLCKGVDRIRAVLTVGVFRKVLFHHEAD